MAKMPKETRTSMKQIHIAKLTMNVGAGKDENMLKKGLILLGKLSSVSPVRTITKKRIPGPGLAIGCKVTVRAEANDLLKRLLVAKENQLKSSNFDNLGNLAFGVAEYIDIAGLEYDPDLKIMGLEIAVTLERAGYSVKRRKIRPAKLGKVHQITKEEAIDFITTQFGVSVE